jgi:hypothetical protein
MDVSAVENGAYCAPGGMCLSGLSRDVPVAAAPIGKDWPRWRVNHCDIGSLHRVTLNNNLSMLSDRNHCARSLTIAMRVGVHDGLVRDVAF